ncbi:hypothetical protein BDV95DRAFT_601042 [Massariosphaeria phaeospora]|uniref:Uncharacterized protein n=1 Tax=Massariosphaeria phaeospora TaxID=100035 RepID=A0A7C8IRP6_9PLEO|nr:hypothetical protein BDV95DRAFT_601042 [Massariosphaeria phaeospora]
MSNKHFERARETGTPSGNRRLQQEVQQAALHCYAPSQLSAWRLNLEGTKILYGENTICLNTWDQHATDYFLRLRPETLAAIRNLHVFYSDTTWVRESPRKNSWDYAVYDYAYYDMLQTRWVQVCSTLQRAHRDSLTLTFESCAIDLNATQRMLGALSKIRVQHLRLSMGAYVRHSQGLTRTLHETVRQCTSSQPASTESPPDSSFPFERLPYELQMNVLSHTGLVITPHSLGMDRVDILWIRVEERPRPLIGGCCGTCNTSNFASCLCHSNYKETISTTCMCERLPDCLFRVSRNFGKMAHRTFYSLNQFYVTGELFEMLQHVENMPSRNLGLVKSFCVDLGIMPAEDCYEYIGKMNWVEELAVYDWNKPRNRKALKKLFKLLHKRGHSDLSIKITSRIQLMLILQHVVEPHDKPQLRIFCDWLARRKYPRVSVMARFSKNRGGFLRQDWDTLFLVSLIEGEETETDDGESWLDSRERLVRWYPYGAAWKDILVGAIYGPKVPLLNS